MMCEKEDDDGEKDDDARESEMRDEREQECRVEERKLITFSGLLCGMIGFTTYPG